MLGESGGARSGWEAADLTDYVAQGIAIQSYWQAFDLEEPKVIARDAGWRRVDNSRYLYFSNWGLLQISLKPALVAGGICRTGEF